ncbi:hypothetical protein PILCRDRAFT_811793 [Piloderma croceum F 1598]|uniref:Squalene synthase n=1 Tax=Piloderma croceum (strain F 1598) TaxID=765440 RepID=A0A0C3CK33_PILCF|nr:hypothetical protein PILCRDRAFT_811793 [Piloderma croceum F 1598]
MTFMSMLTLLLTHPDEFRVLVQFWLYHEQKRDITAQQEHPTSGWDRESMRRCWKFLDMTSRSFAAVIKELDGDLARTICMFYLVLRGLDTIEDDMTIPDDVKLPLLRSFHEHVVTPGWTFDGCGPNERDRELLVNYDIVVEEVNLLKPEYKTVILNICRKMETGMADYAHKAATTNTVYLETVSEYDLYCHYVAGLVGEGLSGLWAASGKEADWIGSQLELSNSMGLLLQKTNIIRDFREDSEEKRYFWPKEIWGKYGFNEMNEMWDIANKERAAWAQSAMILDALRHAIDALDYLRFLKNQSVFNFCAIPATMAMATLTLCFMNPDMFQRNIKIRKAAAAKLIMRSTNPRDVAYMFRDYARKIHSKAVSADPNFIAISIACGKIEQWCEHQYPSFVSMTPSSTTSAAKQEFNPADARSQVVLLDQKREAEIEKVQKRVFRPGDAANSRGLTSTDDGGLPWEVMAYGMAAFAIVILLVFLIIYVVLEVFGDGLKLGF